MGTTGGTVPHWVPDHTERPQTAVHQSLPRSHVPAIHRQFTTHTFVAYLVVCHAVTQGLADMGKRDSDGKPHGGPRAISAVAGLAYITTSACLILFNKHALRWVSRGCLVLQFPWCCLVVAVVATGWVGSSIHQMHLSHHHLPVRDGVAC